MKFEINLSIDWTIQLNEENGVGNGTAPVLEEIEFDQRYVEQKKNTREGCGHKLQKRNEKEDERCSGPKGRGRIVLGPVQKALGAVRSKTKPPSRDRRKQHTCPICRGEGHHARTCRDVLVEENRARAEQFFAQLIETQQLDKYLVCMAKRVSPQFARQIVRAIKTSSAKKAQHDEAQTPGHERREAQNE